MNFSVCSFNGRLLVLLEAPKQFVFSSTANVTCFRQSYGIYPNFLQNISLPLERVCRTYKVVAILYRFDSIRMNNFPNGTQKTITYYVYYTTMDDCRIDDVFYGELLEHLTKNLGMSFYVSQVFLQSLRHGFNKPDNRVDGLVESYNLSTRHDDLEEIRRLVLNLRPEQKQKIEMLVYKNSTFNSILPNMLLLNVTNCIQQDSLSIKHDTADTSSKVAIPIQEDDEVEIEEETISTPEDGQFKTYTDNIELCQHYYYCSYGDCVIIEADIQLAIFNKLIMKHLISAFVVRQTKVDQLHCYLYIDVKKFALFSRVRVHGKILQYKIRNQCFNPRKTQIDYDVDMTKENQLMGTAPLVIGNSKSLNETFKSKIKVVQVYVIACERMLRDIMSKWNCICKVLRIVVSPFNGNVFHHTLIYIHETDIAFLYEYLPTGHKRCECTPSTPSTSHSSQLWQMRPCAEILFHTHFDWTILKIHNDYARRGQCNIFQLYDIYETGTLKIARLLESKVFKVTIENMTTFKFFNETGLLYPFQTTGHEELYIYTLIKMTRIVYRCIVLPLIKMNTLVLKNLVPSKFPLSFAFIDDPLTPTTSVRGPQSTRNLKSIESSDKVFDTKVINVTMLMNSFNLCGSESIENAIKV